MTGKTPDTALEILIEQFFADVAKCPSPNLSIDQMEAFYDAIFDALAYLGNQWKKIDQGATQRIVELTNDARTECRLTCARESLDRRMQSAAAGAAHYQDRMADFVRFLYARGELRDIGLLEEFRKLSFLSQDDKDLIDSALEGIRNRCLEQPVRAWLESHRAALAKLPKGIWLALDGKTVIARGADYARVKKTAEKKAKLFIMYQIP